MKSNTENTTLRIIEIQHAEHNTPAYWNPTCTAQRPGLLKSNPITQNPGLLKYNTFNTTHQFTEILHASVPYIKILIDIRSYFNTRVGVPSFFNPLLG